ncbi:MAG: hypothetical protein ACI93R_001739 [Flavobacteriales bacterium]|jgi:hypothetical protein
MLKISGIREYFFVSGEGKRFHYGIIMYFKNRVILVSLAAIVAVIITGVMLYPTAPDVSVALKKDKVPIVVPEIATLPIAALKPNKTTVALGLSPKTKVKAGGDETLNVFDQPDENPNFETFHDRYQSIVARRAGREFDPDALFEAMKKTNAWEGVDDAPSSFDLADKYRNDGREFIRFSPMKLESLATGDKLKIAIVNAGIDFTATINDVRSSNAGESVTWSGVSDSQYSNETFTITQGESLTVGGIFTDDGLYQLEVKNGQGYIVSNATLFRHGQDQAVEVPQHLIDNPPEVYVRLEAETFGE